MNAFDREPAELREAQLEAVRRVLDSGWYILGSEVETFERAWAAECGAAYAVGVGNGLDAIEIGLRAMGIGAGDEVIVPAMTAFASVLAVMRAGATPVLADIEPRTALLSRASAQRCITRRTRAVMLVHLYGRMDAVDDWATWCASQNVALVEDCAQAHGAAWQGRGAGSWGRFGAFSFYPTKNLGSRGDAGALVTSDPEIARRAAQLRNYGQVDRYDNRWAGLNSRLDELQAAILLARLPWLSRFNDRRREIAGEYAARITHDAIRLLAPAHSPENHVHHLFCVRSRSRESLRSHLAASGVESLPHYPTPAHRQPPCAQLPRDPAGLAAAEMHAAECLSLPCNPQLTPPDVDRVVNAVQAFRA